MIYSENCTINVEEHQPYNRLFRPREFTYIRHLVKNSRDEYFIIDRSIEQNMLQKKPKIVRGSLFIVTKISQDHHHLLLTVDLTINHKGDLIQ